MALTCTEEFFYDTFPVQGSRIYVQRASSIADLFTSKIQAQVLQAS